jgi:hypothetical protein
MTDIAITNLIERIRDGDTDAALELADVVEAATRTPDRRVGAALMPKSRGGEPRWRAQQRSIRDDGFRDLAELVGTDLSLEQRAQEVIRKVTRYRPTPTDQSGSPERRVLHQIAETGLPVPSLRHLKRILGQQ